jgi:geranylgeranyl reductase family protein
MIKTDVLIAGAGPAGVTASLWLSKLGIKHVIADKAVFPRDKVCGDALSGKVYAILHQVLPEIWGELGGLPMQAQKMFGIHFASPDNSELKFHFAHYEAPAETHAPLVTVAPGFIIKRVDFDNLMFNKLDTRYAQVLTAAQLEKVQQVPEGVQAQIMHNNKSVTLQAKIIIGADGERSVVNKQLCGHRNSDSTFAAAVRAYYTGVTGGAEDVIELHFIKELLPGYLWIFPLPDGGWNVGLGMLSSAIKKGKRNLRKEMTEILQTHPKFKNRFANAQLEGKIVGWGLPLGSKRRPVSGKNFILAGDAASFIDPLTGEGIGNSVISGKYAAVYAAKALKENDFSAKALKEYDTFMYNKIGTELRLSYFLQQASRVPWLMNYTIKKAGRSEELKDIFSMMFTDLNIRKKLTDPRFYLRILAA